ncbi:MAG TPA: hypothetical protein VLJ68_02115 [Chitinophagaceae bacterium]|nr:hypothetical protein [Chitinophagaceae bacterium]
MKKLLRKPKKLLVALFVFITLSSSAQNTFTHIAAKENRAGSGDCTRLDNKDLDDNPKAILFITQKDGTHPHPICAFYFKGKWNIMNLDQAAITAGNTYTVSYYTEPDQDHFQYVIKKEDLQRDGTVLIDHPALNRNSNIQFSSFHSWAPESKEFANREETKLAYNQVANKWSISNINEKKVMTVGAAYNFAVTSRTAGISKVGQVDEVLTKPTLGGNNSPGPAANADGDGAWSLNNGHLNNTNTGNVGIANNNPAYQLDVNGRMRIRSGGNNTVSAGLWLNNNANTEDAFIGMEDDTHVGLYGKTAGWKFGMNTQTGALKINGSEGQTGQVLVSNGAAAPGYTTIGNLIRAEMKGGTGTVEAKVKKTEYYLNQLTHTITLTTKSRIIISAEIVVAADCAFYLCDGSTFEFLLKVNNSIVFEQTYTASTVTIRPSICNYMIDLDPGTHTLDFYDHYLGGSVHYISPKYSSIIILPVD